MKPWSMRQGHRGNRNRNFKARALPLPGGAQKRGSIVMDGIDGLRLTAVAVTKDTACQFVAD